MVYYFSCSFCLFSLNFGLAKRFQGEQKPFKWAPLSKETWKTILVTTLIFLFFSFLGGLISFTLRTFVWEDNAYGYNKVINSLVEKGVWDIVSADKIDFNLSDHVGDEDTSLRYYYLITCQKKK